MAILLSSLHTATPTAAQPPPQKPRMTASLAPTDLALGKSLARPRTTGSLLIFSAFKDGNWDIFTWDMNPKHAPQQRTDTPFDESAPSLAPDHSFCAFSTVDGRLWRLSLDPDAVPQQLPFASDQNFDMQPAVSPDNIAVLLATSLDRASDDTDLIVYDTVSKSFRPRLTLLSYQHDPTWAPDGRHAAFAHLQGRLQTGRPISEIWVMRTDAPWARQLTLLDAFSVSPAWSPNSRSIAFASNRGGHFDIWLVDPNTRAFRNLTKHTAADTDPVFAPDSRSILFVSTRGGHLGLWKQDLSATGAKPVTPFGDGDAIPCKDPDWR